VPLQATKHGWIEESIPKAVDSARRTECFAIRSEGGIQAVLDPRRIGMFGAPAAGRVMPPPSMWVEPNNVARCPQLVQFPAIRLGHVCGGAEGVGHLRVHAQEPGEPRRRPSQLTEPVAQRSGPRHHRLEPGPPGAGEPVDIDLVGLHVQAEHGWDRSGVLMDLHRREI
jgi:hypothetical protein